MDGNWSWCCPTKKEGPNAKGKRQGMQCCACGFDRKKTLRRRIAEFFRLRNDKMESFADEIFGGVTMFLLTIYAFRLAKILPADPPENSMNTSATGHTMEQYNALSTSFALCAGISSIFIGVLGNMPFVVAPGIVHMSQYKILAKQVSSPAGVNAANMVVGAVLTLISLSARWVKPVSSVPVDFRLGVAAGIGGLLCFIGLKDSYILTSTATIINEWNFNTLLSILGLILLIVLDFWLGRQTRYSLILEILVIAVLSLVIRGATDTLEIPPLTEVKLRSSFAQVSTETWSDKSFEILRYVIWNVLNKFIDVLSSITAIILAASTRKPGFNSDFFQKSMQESRAIAFVFFADGLCNLIIAPLFGMGLITPYVESVAGVVVGAKTGLAAVVAGCLFLISAPFANQLSSIIQSEATGPALIMSCFTVIKGLRFTDDIKAVKFAPSYLVFMLMSLSMDLGGSVAFSFIILFASWTLTGMRSRITPQMIFGFAMSVLLAMLATGLLPNFVYLAVVSSVLFLLGLFGAIVAAIVSPNAKTDSSPAPTAETGGSRYSHPLGVQPINTNAQGRRNRETRSSRPSTKSSNFFKFSFFNRKRSTDNLTTNTNQNPNSPQGEQAAGENDMNAANQAGSNKAEDELVATLKDDKPEPELVAGVDIPSNLLDETVASPAHRNQPSNEWSKGLVSTQAGDGTNSPAAGAGGDHHDESKDLQLT